MVLRLKSAYETRRANLVKQLAHPMIKPVLLGCEMWIIYFWRLHLTVLFYILNKNKINFKVTIVLRGTIVHLIEVSTTD